MITLNLYKATINGKKITMVEHNSMVFEISAKDGDEITKKQFNGNTRGGIITSAYNTDDGETYTEAWDNNAKCNLKVPLDSIGHIIITDA